MEPPLEIRFNQFVQKHNLFSKKDKLLLAISGGGDSVCLFHLLRKQSYDFHCAHVNYKLRGEESDGDQSFVEDLCKQYNIKLHNLVHDLSSLISEKGNIQNAAREKRYEYFKQLTSENGFDKVLTAHTKTDDLETMLQMFARASGISGISGIPLRRDEISRPLLFAASEEILNWVNSKEYRYRTDSSNASEKYTRNKIRKRVLPILKEIYPNFQSQAGQSMLILKEYNRFIHHQVNNIKKKLVSYKDEYMMIDEIRLRNSDFAELILYEILCPYGFNGNQCTDILNSSQKGLQFYSENYEIISDKESFCLRDRENKTKPVSMQILNMGEYTFPFCTLRIWNETSEIHIFESDNFSVYLDGETLKFPLILRTWTAGDSICPLGMEGKHKKVKEILSDRGINLFDKEKVMVLESDGEICWIPGICISHNFRIEKGMREITGFQFSPSYQTREKH